MVSNQEGTRDAVNALQQILLYLAGRAPHNEGEVCGLTAAVEGSGKRYAGTVVVRKG